MAKNALAPTSLGDVTALPGPQSWSKNGQNALSMYPLGSLQRHQTL